MMKKTTEEPGLQEYKETMVHIHTSKKNVGTEFSKLQNPSYKTSYSVKFLKNLAKLLSLLYLSGFRLITILSTNLEFKSSCQIIEIDIETIFVYQVTQASLSFRS